MHQKGTWIGTWTWSLLRVVDCSFVKGPKGPRKIRGVVGLVKIVIDFQVLESADVHIAHIVHPLTRLLQRILKGTQTNRPKLGVLFGIGAFQLFLLLFGRAHTSGG